MNYVGMKDFENFICRAFQVDFRAEAQLFVGTVRSDDGIDQAGSGVAGIGETDGLSLVSVFVQAVYSTKVAVFEELGAAVLVD
ncbi:hypothetical protein Tco_0221673 [Tanacetum coccineum]